MLRIHSFLQNICRSIASLSKQFYHICAVLIGSLVMISVIVFYSLNFVGTQQSMEILESETEEVDAGTEAKIPTKTSESVIELQSVSFTEEHETINFLSAKEKGAEITFLSSEVVETTIETAQVETAPMETTPAEATVAESVQGGDALLAQLENPPTEGSVNLENEKVISEEYVPIVAAPLPATYNSFAAEYVPTDEEYNILLHIVASEAGGCDMVGQILVANVIMNRVAHDSFPDDIVSVVFERNQFTPALTGTIYYSTVTDSVREAVDRALTGEDYSKGAYFFSARARLDYDSMSWFDNNLNWLFEHDGHEFYSFR